MSNNVNISQGGSFGSQPECWEEPAGIMDSIVGIIPRSVPQRATSFSGLLGHFTNETPMDDTYNNSGPPTPYDNEGSQDDENNNNLPSMSALPTFSFLKIDVEAEKRRNINLSKLWDINPLVSLPPPSAASSVDLLSVNTPTAQDPGMDENDTFTSTPTITSTPTTTTTTSSSHSLNHTRGNSELTETENEENDKDDDENELLSPHSSPPVRGQPTTTTTTTTTSSSGATSPGTEKRKRKPYNTRNRIAAAQAQAQIQAQLGQEQEATQDDDVGIQPRSKRKRPSTTDVEVPTSDPDLATSPLPPSRKARGGTTPARRGRGARNNVASPSSPPSSSSPISSSPQASAAPIQPVTTTPTKPTYTNVTMPIVPTHTPTLVPTHTATSSRAPGSPPPSPTATANQIKSLEAKFDTHERQVDDLRSHQATLLTRADTDYKDLLRQHERTSAGVRTTHGDADTLIRSVVLEPAQISRVRNVRDSLNALLVRLRVLWREATIYAGTASSSTSDSNGALLIREQAPPRVIFKGKEHKDMGKVCVELITPTKIRCEILTPVTVSLCSTSAQKKDSTNIKTLASSSPFVGYSQDVDNNMMAIFEQLKLTTSTRMICSNLRFHLSMKTTGPSEKGRLVEIESEPSFPFIAITNESQWPEAAGKLLYSDAFDGDKIETSWANYANMLQLHFMTITDQTLENPARKFYPWELRYIHSRFGYRSILSKDATEKFWGFFGPVLLNIHFKRKIYDMWRDGLIYGLISKEECSAVLTKQKEGTFLIRFSESIPGAFAIAYVNSEAGNASEKVRHYLVKSDDLGSNKTLPDYLKEKNQFTTILKLDPASKALEAIPKDEALELLYSKRNFVSKPPEGYIGFL